MWVQVVLVDEVLALCTGMVEMGGAGTVWVLVRLVVGEAGTAWVLVGLVVEGAGTLVGLVGGCHSVGTG